ncbi:glycoside hydrolase [Clavulina sp. PMI_390]|nr:glycoside hydrolase [Clavulina sp. PMI_390]
MLSLVSASTFLVMSFGTSFVFAYGDTCNTNVVGYWGQNSYGAANSADTANYQQRLSYYCNDDSVDVFPIAFLDVFSSTGDLPQINLANTCNEDNASYFTGSQLLDCSFLAADIETCQANGKKVTISLGGATGGGTADAAFADQIWDLFLGGSSSTRPFGDAVLDGVDLDIEGGSNSYVDFVNQLRTHYSGASKKYYVTAAPQCPYPDAYIGSSLNGAEFDAIYVQFYNNACSVTNYGESAWNFGTWDYWANRISPNPDIKVYLGVPASSSAAGSGYVAASTVNSISATLQKSFPSFGGVMFWDESQAYVNGRFDTAVKSGISGSGTCSGFTYPACTAEAWSASGTYPTGSQVTYDNYIWQARYYGSGTPSPSDTGSWVPISACGGGSTSSSSSSTTSKSSTTTTSTTTSKASTTTTTAQSSSTTSSAATTTTSTSSSGGCSGVAAWSSTTAYNGGSEVTYNGELWENSYWSYNDVPGGTAGVWVEIGTC